MLGNTAFAERPAGYARRPGIREYVQSNMTGRLGRFFRTRRIRHPRPQQLELTLWPKRQIKSETLWKESAMMRKKR
jgi:hypothetical protein